MIVSVILLVLGLGILIKGSDFMVDGASSIASVFRIPPMVIGLTIVAFGTSAPELLVSIVSSIQGANDLALGNILGSNIANILLILGITALIYPIRIENDTIWKEIPLTLLGAVTVTVLGLQSQIDTFNFSTLDLSSTETISTIGRTGGMILLFFFIIFLYYTISISTKKRVRNEQIKHLPLSQGLLYTGIGILGLGLGSTLFVNNTIDLANSLGVSQGFIGLTLVAFGTSAPELVASITAARKRHTEIALGNVIGSNIYNIFFVLGVTSLINPIPLTGQNIADILALLITTIILFIITFLFTKQQVGKKEGSIMLLLYMVYLIFIWVR